MDAPILITGSTGFLGHHVLGALLHRNRTCVAGVRPPGAAGAARLQRLLANLGLDAAGLMRRGRLDIIELELPGNLNQARRSAFECIVHCAGSTVFNARADGEPTKSNVLGTRALCALAEQRRVSAMILLSTAYVCGQAASLAEEPLQRPMAAFNNAYEASKWEAENEVLGWAQRTGGLATLVRPAICIGDSQSGRATTFQGFYLLARATQLLSATLSAGADRRAIALRIRGCPERRQNLMPVDHCAAVVAAIAADPRRQGRVYHVTHPCAPTNAQIKAWLEQYFDIAGGRFVNPREPLADLSAAEQAFYGLSQPIVEYFLNTPEFERGNTTVLEQEIGAPCPPIDGALISRCLDHALSANWGRRSGADGAVDIGICAAYFERFLPARVSRSKIAHMTRLTAAVRFVIGGPHGYRCVCHFDRGLLARVERLLTGSGSAEFGYRASYAVFLEAIAGRRRPQELFFAQRAEIDGDVEQALKMAMILHEFTREFPCAESHLRAGS